MEYAEDWSVARAYLSADSIQETLQNTAAQLSISVFHIPKLRTSFYANPNANARRVFIVKGEFMTKKRIIITSALFLLIFLVSCTTPNKTLSSSSSSDLILEKSFGMQNVALGWSGQGVVEHYVPFNEKQQGKLYIDLKVYREDKQTDISVEDIQKYLSSGFEEDGSVRIYNNGKHKWLKDFIDWYYSHDGDTKVRDYSSKLQGIYMVYREDNLENPLNYVELYDLPLEEIDKIMEKAENPDYELVLEDVALSTESSLSTN